VAKTFREVWRWLLPRNFAKPEQVDDEGALVAQSLTTVIDTTLTRAREGLNARFPTRAGASAVALTAGDRGLLRGRAESLEDFTARLVAWRTPRTHLVRGNAYELLRQVSAYWGGIKCTTIANGYEHTHLANGSESKAVSTFTLSEPTRWARFWVTVILDASVTAQPDLDDPALWGGALGTPGYTLGQTNVTPADVLAMRNLFQQYAWHPEHAQPEWLVVRLTPFSPSAVAENWSYYDAGTETQKAARDLQFAYWSLDPTYNNTYSGDPENWPKYAATLALGGAGHKIGPGDPASAAAWAVTTLPNGETYTGNPESFPIDVLLCDDGSIPQ
jgi:hypothetical protein